MGDCRSVSIYTTPQLCVSRVGRGWCSKLKGGSAMCANRGVVAVVVVELITEDRSPPPTPPYTHRVSNLSLTLDWPPLSINWYCLHYKLHFTLSEHPSSKLDFNPPLFQTPSDWRHPPWSSSCRRSRSARWRSTAAPSTRTSRPGLESCCSDSPPSAQSPPPSSSSSSSSGSSARPPSRPWYGTCSSQATASSGQALIRQLTPPRIRSLVSDPS